MSCVIPEVVIQAALVAGMRYLREDPSRFGQLFRDFPKSKRDSIAQWFANNRVRLVMGFPEQTATFPLWSIRVMGDNESQSFIGDHLGNNILPRNAPVQYGQADEDSGESFFLDEPDLLGGGVTWQTGPTAAYRSNSAQARASSASRSEPQTVGIPASSSAGRS